jgi:superkiller protein 3
MAEISNRTKRIVGEIAVLICLGYVWGVNSPAVTKSRVKAGYLKQVVKAEPDNVDAYRFLADYYIQTTNYQQAADALKQVVRLEPRDSHSWMLLGDMHSICNNHDGAMAAYRQVADLHTDNAQAHYQLGVAYLKVEEKDMAKEEYKKLKKLDKQLANDLLDQINGNR